MSTLVRTETGRDARGNKFLTNVYESFTTITPDTAASSWTLTQADGVFTLTETYTEQVPDPGGGGGGGTTFPDIWSLDVSTISDPIETNEYFKNGMSGLEMSQWTAWKQGRDTGYPDGFPQNSTNNVLQQLLLRFNRGETDYLTPRLVLKHQKVYSVPPSFDGVGYATSEPAGNPFTFRTDVNFLLTGATAVQEGANYRVTLEWLTSSPGNWDPYIYGGGA
jgi:hypothetical protein